MKKRVLLVLLVLLLLLTIICQTAGGVGGEPSMGDGSKGSTVIPETSSSKDSNVTSKKSDLGTPKKIISKIKETLLKQSQIQHKLLQQRIKQQKLTKKVQKKSISKLPLFWGYMTSEHRAMWNEGNPYLRQSLTRYYNIYGNQK